MSEKFSQHQNDQYRIQSELHLRIKDIFSSTICFHRTADQHNAEMVRMVWSTKNYARLTNWRKGYLHGMSETLWNGLYDASQGHTPLLEYVKIGPDGRMFRPGDDSWLKESTEYKQSFSELSSHAWTDAMDKGEFKPW